MADKKKSRVRCDTHDLLYHCDDGPCPLCQVEWLKKENEGLKAALRRATGGEKNADPLFVKTDRHDKVALACLLMFGAIETREYRSDYELFYPEDLPTEGGRFSNEPVRGLDNFHMFLIYGRPALLRARDVYRYFTRVVVSVRTSSLSSGYSKGVAAVMETLTEMSGEEVVELERESYKKLGFSFDRREEESALARTLNSAGDDLPEAVDLGPPQVKFKDGLAPPDEADDG